MTPEELSEKLDQLDPGATLTVAADTLAHMFGAVELSYESRDALRRIADFALEHRCTFSFHEKDGAIPCFQKNDIF